jgi:glycosyltransferase involved in cell wall biosynthesis
MTAAESGWKVLGIDNSDSKVHQINSGVSPVEDVSDYQLKSVIENGSYVSSTDFTILSKAQIIIICVPTPLNKEREPDLSILKSAVSSIAPNISNATISPQAKEMTSPFRILTVGRISPEKGYYEALEAIRAWNPKSEIHWDIVGLKENAELVNAIQLSSKECHRIHVQMHGHKNQDELKTFYEKAHLFFLPSRGENYGHAIAEALSNGIPVIISDQTPWKNLEAEFAGKSSSLNPKELAASLDFFLNLSNETYRKWSDGALIHAQKQINTHDIILKNKNLFNNLFK